MNVGEDATVSPGTRERILRVAEELFARDGFESTSVREITRLARCNVAAVNYHFGGKESLYEAVFAGLLDELRERRIQHIEAALDRAGDEASLETFLEAFADSFLDPLLGSDRGRYLMSFIDNELRHPHLPPEMMVARLFRPLHEVGLAALDRTGPRMAPECAALCLMSLVGQLIHALKIRERMPGGMTDLVPADLHSHVRHIVRFSAAGFRAMAEEDRGGDGRSPRRPEREEEWR